MSRSNPQSEEKTLIRSKEKLKPPSMYRVLLHNDNYTTMDFVIFVLESIFHKSPWEATEIMLHVHQNGVGICGVYPFEIAETKVQEVHDLAEQYEFPLQASMEEV